MKKIVKSKLSLNAETLIALSNADLLQAQGGMDVERAGIGSRTCPTRCSMCPACNRLA